ncbi:MAG TPA: PD-(D/E)XK nuclease family protein, partial [Solimonas sp.]|nr:PD-(D/E)XK nuclease family protein [Solimonas sp.]
GFHESTSVLRRLLEALQAAGSQLAWLQPVERPAVVQALALGDAEQELRAAAAWARQRAEADPQARIAVVIPDLQARRAMVQRLFDEQLCPIADAPESHSLQRPYNLTLGEPLAATGLVQVALRLLQLQLQALPYAEAGALLCSPGWGGGEPERLERAALDARLRRDGHVEVSLDTLRAQNRDGGLQQRLDQLAALSQPRRRASAGEWVEWIAEVLDQAGWPGPRALDSEEFQQHQAWRQCLVELARLETVLGRVSCSAALAQLRELAEQTLFQPQSPVGAIQVMGALEAGGLDFDHLWVAGLDDEHWPPPARPHPFIPWALQRSHGLPHASAAQELAYAQRMTARWVLAAPEVLLSWPRQDQDRPLSPSPLLAPWLAQASTREAVAVPDRWQQQQRAAAEAGLETLLDAQAPPLPEGVAPGGSRLLGDQALCPFRGFATHRLGARALEIPQPGLSAADRGNLVHRILEDLWRGLRDQQSLLSLDDAGLSARIGEAVDAALAKLLQEAPQRLRPGLRSLEGERLRRLIRDWLEQEKLRLPFRVIELEGTPPEASRGNDQLVEFEGLQLRLRRDRVDEIEGGGQLVLDYKTGAARKPPWIDPRPEEPQLLIYALSGGPVVAIAYGRVLAGAVGFKGLADAAGYAPGIDGHESLRGEMAADSWTALLGRWRGELRTVAGEVREGWAAVSPKHPRQTCRDCDLHALCRIRESVSEVAEDGGEA